MSPIKLNTLVLIGLYVGMVASIWLLFLSTHEPTFLALAVALLVLMIFVFIKALKQRSGMKRK